MSRAGRLTAHGGHFYDSQGFCGGENNMETDLAWRSEYEALTGGAGCADASDRSRIEVRGSDRVRFLHSFCTNDIQRLVPGNGCGRLSPATRGRPSATSWSGAIPRRCSWRRLPGRRRR
jgi:glycine cleavage system aminomethyltransferase T